MPGGVTPRLTPGAGFSESQVAAGGGRERLGGPDVVVEQGGQVAVSGLGSDPVDHGAVDRRGGGVAGAQRLVAKGEVAETGRGGAVADEVADRTAPVPLARDRAGRWHAGEQRPGPGEAEVKPGAEGADRIGGGMHSRGDTDFLAERLLVGLGASNGDEQAVAAEADVRQMECGDLTWPQLGRVPQQQNGSVADAVASRCSPRSGRARRP